MEISRMKLEFTMILWADLMFHCEALVIVVKGLGFEIDRKPCGFSLTTSLTKSKFPAKEFPSMV